MPSTKVIKSKPVEATKKTLDKTKPVKVKATSGAESELEVPAVRKSRASSCPRYLQQQQGRCERTVAGVQGLASKPGCERRARSTSIAPKLTEKAHKTNPDHRRASISVRHTAVYRKCRDTSVFGGQRVLRGAIQM